MSLGTSKVRNEPDGMQPPKVAEAARESGQEREGKSEKEERK